MQGRSQDRSYHVVIVGGGISGLAAGVELSSPGVAVTVLEQKPGLGGRAYSFVDPTTGDVIDNGQHVMIAGYDRTMRFLEKIGTRDLVSVQQQPALVFHHPQKEFKRFQVAKLPAPFHLVWGILGCTLLSFGDRLGLLRAGLAIRRGRVDIASLTIEEWLDLLAQSVECKRSFWEPLAVSIMNEKMNKASALIFMNALRTAFLGDWQNASLVIPKVGLSQLYAEPARDFIVRNGGTVLCGADVLEIGQENDLVTSVQVRGREALKCDALILAVPPVKCAALLPETLRHHPSLAALQEFPSSPIVSVHLWFDTDMMNEEFVGLIGRRVQWVFNKRKLNREPGKGAHISVVISAAENFVTLTNDELVRLAIEDLRSAWAFNDPIHAVVIREKRATYSSTPEVERLRPDQETPVKNLFLAGDWTKTGYPATIEGALYSGQRCASLIQSFLLRVPS